MSGRWKGLSVGLSILLAAACGNADEPPESGAGTTSGTTRALLNLPRADNVSTERGSAITLQSGGEDLTIDLLGINLGSPDAPLKVIEFVDFGCGFCASFHAETFPRIQESFIATGMVEWKLMPFVGGMFENSLQVTEAAECALELGSPQFGAFSSLLWQLQSEWKPADDPAAMVRGWAEELRFDMERYDSCLAEDRRMARVAGATKLADQFGVRSTPTVWMVGLGPIQGALPYESFQEVFTKAYDAVTAGRAVGGAGGSTTDAPAAPTP